MVSADGNLVITFNGEIYNYQALLRALEDEGRIFRTQSDTEVLLHLYAVKGAGMLDDLRGMFAFAIWDARRGELFAARDRFGIKPFYYADDCWTFRFAWNRPERGARSHFRPDGPIDWPYAGEDGW